jgi:hypothetical protein
MALVLRPSGTGARHCLWDFSHRVPSELRRCVLPRFGTSEVSLLEAGNERASRNIGDFTRWKEHDAYQKALDRLPCDLRVEKG